MNQELFQGFPVVIEFPIAWGEMDSFGHVNNIYYFRYCESARLAYFERLAYTTLKDETGLGPILATANCRFRLPLTYPDTVSVATRILKLEEDRFVMEYRIISHRVGKVAAEGDSMVVSYDYRAGRKAPVPEVLRQRIAQIEGWGAVEDK